MALVVGDSLIAETILRHAPPTLVATLELVCRSWRDMCADDRLWLAACKYEWGTNAGSSNHSTEPWRARFFTEAREARRDLRIGPFDVVRPATRCAPGEELFVVVIGRDVYEVRPGRLAAGAVHRVRLRLGSSARPAAPVVPTLSSLASGAPVFVSSMHMHTDSAWLHRGLLRHSVVGGKLNLYHIDYRTWRCRVLVRNCASITCQPFAGALHSLQLAMPVRV